MQWLMLLGWAALARYGERGKRRAALMRVLVGAAIVTSMLAQLRLLWKDGLLSVQTGLPLHLCGLFGVLTPILMTFHSKPLLDAFLLLGSPCALITLFFPAVIQSTEPFLMRLAFYRLHVLIACAPLMVSDRLKVLTRRDAARTLVLGNVYLALVALCNAGLDSNYLFLRYAPAGTPLAPLLARGGVFYFGSLNLLFMLLSLWLMRFINAIAENKKAYIQLPPRS